MGNIRRINRSMKKNMASRPIAMADTKVAINGCRIFLGHPDPQKAKISADKFRTFFTQTIARANVPNLHDMYNAHFDMCESLKKGESFKDLAKNG